MVSSMVSPATKRVVSFLKALKRVAKSFKPSLRDNQISAFLVIIISVRVVVCPCVILGGAFLPPAKGGACTRASERGTCPDAIEARIGRFIACGVCGRRFLYRARAGCLLREGLVQ